MLQFITPYCSYRDDRVERLMKLLYERLELMWLSLVHIRLQLHAVIYRPNSFVLMLRYCVNLKAMRYESKSMNRIVADKSHSVIVA